MLPFFYINITQMRHANTTDNQTSGITFEKHTFPHMELNTVHTFVIISN